MNIEEIRSLIKGLPLKEARVLLSEHNLLIRVTIEDGKELICTSDLRPDRVNVYVSKGKISSVENVG